MSASVRFLSRTRSGSIETIAICINPPAENASIKFVFIMQLTLLFSSETEPLSKNNATDSVDIGVYGLYGTTSTYSGLFRDASDSGKWKLFKDLTSEPTTTVDTTHASYSLGTLVADIEGDVTGQISDISNHNTGDITEGTKLY